MSKNNAELLQKVRFFDPHPGLAGCMVPIPSGVKAIADELDGVEGQLGSAVFRIEYAVTLLVGDREPYKVEATYTNQQKSEGMITLVIGDGESFGTTVNAWRVLRFVVL